VTTPSASARRTSPASSARPRRPGRSCWPGSWPPPDGAALLRQLTSSGFRPKAAFLAGTSDAGYQPPSLGRLATGTLSAGYWSPAQASPGQLAIISPTLGRKYSGSPDYAPAAVAYAVAEVLTDALATAGSTEPAKVNTAIAHTDARTTAGLVTFNQLTHTAITAYHVTR
jgi:branched-chain amino acid transport system substrate-binding protein